MNGIENILFDLDGTIIEPEEGIVNSVLYALNKLGIQESNKEDLKNFIGPPLIDSFKIYYELSESAAIQAVNYYREFFSQKGIYQNALYPNIEKVLKGLAKNGFQLFVATSKPTVYAKQIIENFNLGYLFRDVVGSNLDNTRKDKTEIIEYLISNFELDRSQTLMIGDRKFDILGGKNNSIGTIAVSYGHGSMKELMDSNPDLIVNDCIQLKDEILKTAYNNV